jgi:hypothetical protein
MYSIIACCRICHEAYLGPKKAFARYILGKTIRLNAGFPTQPALGGWPTKGGVFVLDTTKIRHFRQSLIQKLVEFGPDF